MVYITDRYFRDAAIPVWCAHGENKRHFFQNLFSRRHLAASTLSQLYDTDFSEKENPPFLRPYK
jgi:hypothetical protein